MPKSKRLVRFTVPVVELPPNDICIVNGDAEPGELALISDEHGNSVGGFIERIDGRTHLAWVRIDRSTYKSAYSA